MARGFSSTDSIDWGTGGGVGAAGAWSAAGRCYSTSAAFGTIVAKRTAFSAGNNQFTLIQDSARRLAISVNGQDITFVQTFGASAWTSFAFGCDASSVAGYVGSTALTRQAGSSITADWSSGTNTNQRLGVGRLITEGLLTWPGYIAEIALWNAKLTASECLSFTAGYSPLMIRPGALVHYFPIIGRATTEMDLIGGLSGTLTGTTTQNHPRIIYPARRRSIFVPSAATGRIWKLAGNGGGLVGRAGGLAA